MSADAEVWAVLGVSPEALHEPGSDHVPGPVLHTSLSVSTARLLSPKNGKICSSKTPIDAQALKRKVSKATCHPAVHAVLSSLLLYVTDHEDRPQGLPPADRAEGQESKVSRTPEDADAHRRPTRFQLLQAKFMGTGREPPLKKTREVGRLIFKDKQGPSRSVVTATIGKLLEKTREPLHSEKPRWGLPAGKSTVKNVLKTFLAAEGKEAREKEALEKPPAEQPQAARGALPKMMGKRSWVLSTLREKFEQSGRLCSEACVLPLRTEDRKKKNLQRKTRHQPEARVLRMATLASTCIRTPLARFLACTAEPVPAFSIATVVCGPRSWLSHGSKISHSGVGPVPRQETGTSPNSGETVPGGNKTPGKGRLAGVPSEAPVPRATAPRDSLGTMSTSVGPVCVPEPSPSPASCRGQAFPGRKPTISTLGVASPGHAGATGGDRTGDPQAGGATDDTRGTKAARAGLCPGPPGWGAGVAPKVTLMVCSSEDETERTISDSEREPLFAIQKNFPEENVPGRIPALNAQAAQATRHTHADMEPPQITVRLPVVHEMPPPPATLQRAPGCEDPLPQTLEGEHVVGNTQALFPTSTESGSHNTTTARWSNPSGTRQASGADSSPEPLWGAASADRHTPVAAPMQKPQGSPTGREDHESSLGNADQHVARGAVSIEAASEHSSEGHQLPESDDTATGGDGAPPRYSTASESRPGGTPCSAPGWQQGWAPKEGSVADVPTLLAATAKNWMRSQSLTSTDKRILREQEEGRRPPVSEPAQALLRAEGSANHDPSKSRLSSVKEHLEPGDRAPRQMTAAGATKSHTVPAPGNALNPENNVAEEWKALHRGECSSSTSHDLPSEDLGREPNCSLFLAPGGPSERRSRAAESCIRRDSGLRPPLTSGSLVESLAACPQEATGSPPVLKQPRVRVSNEWAASTWKAAGGSRNTGAAQASPWGDHTKSPVPASNHPSPQGSGAVGPPCHTQGKGLAPSESQQPRDEESVVSEKQLPLSAGASCQLPSVPSTAAEGQQAHGESQKCPNLQAGPQHASRMLAGVPESIEAKERPRPQAGPRGREDGASGPRGLAGPGKKGEAPRGQKAAVCGAAEAQTQPRDGRAMSDTSGAQVETPCPPPWKGPEHPLGLQARRVEAPTRGHGTQAEENQSPSSPERPGHQAQAQAGRMVPHDLTRHTDSLAAMAPTAGESRKSQGPAPRVSQGGPRAPHKAGERQPKAPESQPSPRPEPAQGSAVSMLDPGDHQTPSASFQEGPLDTPGAGRGLPEPEHRRRSARFEKYRAQSFCDQRSFDLSFRPTAFRANNSCELPK
ncbi:hypothetical protein HPG69_009580 [Diceros bicornis minor]|uniref:Uncharacterized protein n=1 Tax=Diceros bicornis minor TaxID=77932 RepID=A0A7J7EX04_DICBM|nr:hypothetical protein HPG69_009580 [Diceros bicornis minor]